MKKDQELLQYSRTGNLLMVEKLLSPRSKSSTTRSLAASFGIKVGANVNCQDQSGYTPLHHAGLNGHRAVVQLLLQNAASVNISDCKGSFPLHLASWSGNHEIVNILLTHGPSVAKVNEKNGDNETALHCASQHGHTKTVVVLLRNGADPSVRNIRDESPLDLASQYGRLQVVRLLLQHQPSLLKRFPECFSPLHLASRNGHKEVVELLIAHGADVNRNGENGSALHEAALFGKLDVVKLLLSRGANPHMVDPQNRSPLELVKQLDTQTSRDIATLILSRVQDGEDYEPISPVANVTLTASCLRNFLHTPSTPESPHTYLDMSKVFLEGKQRPTEDVKKDVPEVSVEEHYVASDSLNQSTASFPVARSSTFKGFGSSWGRSSGGKSGFNLRRTASARSSKSLPRLPSTRSRSPASSFAASELTIPFDNLRQHHPSSNMFPVSQTCGRRIDGLRRSSSSLPSSSLSVLSLQVIPAHQPLKMGDEPKRFTREPLKSEDDSVFLPSTPTGILRRTSKSRRARSLDPQTPLAQRLKQTSENNSNSKESSLSPQSSTENHDDKVKEKEYQRTASVESMSKLSPASRPKKPARHKLSTITSPPPIPPKPSNMTHSPKNRPPSPDHPPPSDEEFDFEEENSADECPEKADDLSLKDPISCKEDEHCAAQEPVYSNFETQAPPPVSLNNQGTSASGSSSPERIPSPTFSPPSPHSAMIEISETLQQAISHESIIDNKLAKSRLDSSCSARSNMTSSERSYTSSNTEKRKTSFVQTDHASVTSSTTSTVSSGLPLTSSPISQFSKLLLSSEIPIASDAETLSGLTSSTIVTSSKSVLKETTLSLKTEVTKFSNIVVETKEQWNSMQSNDAVLQGFTDQMNKPMQETNEQTVQAKENDPSPSPKSMLSQANSPAQKVKPQIRQKPKIKPKPQSIKTRPIKQNNQNLSNPDESGSDYKVHDSTMCYVTGGAEVKRARILSTRSNDNPFTVDPESTPSTPTCRYFQSVDSVGKVIERGPIQNGSLPVESATSSSVVNVICSAISNVSPAGCLSGGLEDKTPINEDPQFQYDTPRVRREVPTAFQDEPGTLDGKKELGKVDGNDATSNTNSVDSPIVDWDDQLSDRTEDFEMPTEVRKFRGLIRGASYRSRSKSRYSAVGRDRSPYDEADRYIDYSDGYGAENDDEDILDSPFSRINPALLRDDITPVKVALVKSMTREATSKRPDMDEGMGPVRYSSGLQPRRELRKKRSSRRSDGGDSPMSSSSAEEYDRTAERDGNKMSLTSGSDGEKSPVFSKELRTNSYYDNNNNNSSQASSKAELVQKKSSDTESVGRLPDFDTIVDTVAAVRNRSIRGSKSDSGSSASSTLNKQPTPDGAAPAAAAEVSNDDSDEWAKIANVLSSIGDGLNKGPVYAKEFEETFWKIMTGSELPRQVSTWLTELGLPQYEKVLTGNGFDDVDFLANDILGEQDLIDMDITDASHRRRMLESAKNLPKLQVLPPTDSPLAPCSVGEWLASLHLPEYETAFLANEYHTMANVRTMADFEVKPLVVNRGHLKRIVASLRSTNQQKSKQSSRKSSTTQAKASPPLSRSPLLETANFFKDYNTIVNSRATATLSSTASTGSPAFQSGTVSSTSSSSNGSNIGSSSGHSAEDRVPNHGRIPSNIPEAAEPVNEPEHSSRSHRRHRSSSRSSHGHTHVTEREGDRRPSTSSKRSRSHRHRSSKDSDSTKPRSRSGSSTRTRQSDLSVFVDLDNKLTESQNHNRSKRRASSSSRGRERSQKENHKMSSAAPSTAHVPDAERATYLASESDGAGLNLRPPNETTREVSVSAWRHAPDVLINSSCNYQAYYLGSMLIPELKGVESTMEACAKMKKSTDAMKKIPTITLSINYRGVKFIDFKTKHEIAEHEVQNISFASQDTEDLATFAYITHDVRTGHHYCHVFRVTTMDMAYEIILTLGQAFEVAYQLILKDKALKQST